MVVQTTKTTHDNTKFEIRTIGKAQNQNSHNQNGGIASCPADVYT